MKMKNFMYLVIIGGLMLANFGCMIGYDVLSYGVELLKEPEESVEDRLTFYNNLNEEQKLDLGLAQYEGRAGTIKEAEVYIEERAKKRREEKVKKQVSRKRRVK